MPHIFLNGEIVEESAGTISTADRGLILGDGLFESMRAYNGRVFRLHAHLARLRESAKFFRLKISYDDDEIVSAIAELMRLNEAPEAYVRVTLTRGTEPKGLRLDGAGKSTFLINVRPLQPYPPEQYRNGCKLIISSYRQNSASPLAQHKTTNYLLYLLARQQATDAGANGAILLNEGGYVAEESVSNIFFVRSGKLITPPVHCGLLPGIARATVLELAAANGIAAEEKPVAGGEIFDSEEIFLTNSLMEILPVRSVDRRQPSAAVPGPITMRLQELYRALVNAETRGEPAQMTEVK